jgi:hypothetical protein
MSIIKTARTDFHAALRSDVYVINNGVASNADKDSKPSKAISERLASFLGVGPGVRLAPQTVGARFEKHTMEFLRATFLELGHLRPGDWDIHCVNSRTGLPIAKFDQYQHLADLEDVARKNPSIRSVLGPDYSIASDVVIARRAEDDSSINANGLIVEKQFATRASLRTGRRGKPTLPTLHACISCKWTMRSDRAQNSRAEALRLIRSRKGRTPHIVVVTAEPLPSRLASIALGTGDIDCVYHIALPELMRSVKHFGESEARSIMSLMIKGRRLKDISDLPLDLAV